MSNFAELAEQEAAGFILRWRGRQEGPYPASVVEARLAANEIGMLHEILRDGRWVTIREYINERERALRAQRDAQQLEERQARVRNEQQRAAVLAEEGRKNNLRVIPVERPRTEPVARAQAAATVLPHRGRLILALALAGMIAFGPLCVIAWAMAGGDLRKMKAGGMDSSGRANTMSGRIIGMLGTILWVAYAIILLAGIRTKS